MHEGTRRRFPGGTTRRCSYIAPQDEKGFISSSPKLCKNSKCVMEGGCYLQWQRATEADSQWKCQQHHLPSARIHHNHTASLYRSQQSSSPLVQQVHLRSSSVLTIPALMMSSVVQLVSDFVFTPYALRQRHRIKIVPPPMTCVILMKQGKKKLQLLTWTKLSL